VDGWTTAAADEVSAAGAAAARGAARAGARPACTRVAEVAEGCRQRQTCGRTRYGCTLCVWSGAFSTPTKQLIFSKNLVEPVQLLRVCAVSGSASGAELDVEPWRAAWCSAGTAAAGMPLVFDEARLREVPQLLRMRCIGQDRLRASMQVC
jgi:hypothetical protein